MATTAIKERPIPFTPLMVRAILQGRKRQTRRVIKPQPIEAVDGKADWMVRGRWKGAVEPNTGQHSMSSPYGKPGDRLWVRETMRCTVGGMALYKDGREGPPHPKWNDLCDVEESKWLRFRSGRFMPRWASRVMLEITDVRVERLQEISHGDIVAEGSIWAINDNDSFGKACNTASKRAKEIGKGFAWGVWANRWDAINSKRGFGWDKNPWVWVVEFAKL